MPTTILPANVWLAILLWIVLYISDYALTLYGARLRGQILAGRGEASGSYELNPLFQKDVDAQRRISPRFVLMLLLTTLLLLASWWLNRDELVFPQAFDFVFGVMLLLELAIHMRHLRNIVIFKLGAGYGGVMGAYPRWLTLKISAFELYSFAALFLLLALATRLVFFAGGTLGCFVTGARHWQLALKAMPRAEKTQMTAPEQSPE